MDKPTDFNNETLKAVRDITKLYKKAHEMDCLNGYVKANVKTDCDRLRPLPSREVLKQYNLRLGDCNTFIWWLMEEYFKGNLERKQIGKKENGNKT